MSYGRAARRSGLFLFLAFIAAAQSDDLVAKSRAAKQAMDSGNFAAAIPVYEELLRTLPGNNGMRMNLGLALHSAGRYQEAIPEFESVLKQQPGLTPARFLLALAWLKLNQPARAIAPLRAVVKAEPENKRARLELADALLEAGSPVEAAEHFRILTTNEPGFAKAWQGLGLSYSAISQQSFRELEKINPDSVYCDLIFARSLVNRGRFDSAFKTYREALAKAPAMHGIHSGLAEVYRKTNHPEWAEIEEQRERALPAQGGLPASYTQAVRASEFADHAFEQLSRLPESAEIHDLLAQAFSIQEKYKDAATEWEKAVNMAPEDRRLTKSLAVALSLSGDHERARALLDKLLRAEPQSPELNFHLGDALLRAEATDEAIPYLEAAVRYTPENKRARSALGTALLRSGRPEVAIEHLKAALALDDEGRIHYQLAKAYIKTGHPELADSYLRKFNELSNTARARRLRTDLKITAP
jgi:tetratricopeptide (TPR) repeat protein